MVRFRKAGLFIFVMTIITSIAISDGRINPIHTGDTALAQTASSPSGVLCTPPGPPNYWCVSPTSLSSSADTLAGVSVVDYNNVWAAGTSNATITGGTPLVKHWDGSSWVDSSIAITSNTSSGLGGVTTSYSGSSGSIWAVGAAYQSGQGCTQCILVEHSTGGGFSPISNLINPGEYGNALNSVMMVDDAHVWAVGEYNHNGIANDKVLIESCATGGCNPVDDSNLNHGTGFNALLGIAGTPDTVYAVGYWSPNGAYTDCKDPSENCYPLILKGSGSNGNYSWARVDDSYIDNTGTNAVLRSVDWFRDNDVWAVGSYYDNVLGAFQPLIMHWDGNRWHMAQNINSPGLTGSQLSRVFVTRERDVWAVGNYLNVCQQLSGRSNPDCGTPTPTPTAVATPSPQWGAWGEDASSTSVPLSATLTDHSSKQQDGKVADAIPAPGSRTFIMHWHGSSVEDIDGNFWDTIASPSPGGWGNQLLAVAAPPPSQPTTSAWAVGNYSDDGTSTLPLVENFVAPAAPQYSRNYFMEELNATEEKAAGYSAGSRGETGAIVLDYGSTRDLGNGVYGTSLPPGHSTKVTTDQIAQSVESFVAGYHAGYCAHQPPGCPEPPIPTITVAVGTDNYSLNGYVPSLTFGHARAWSIMVRNIKAYVRNNGFLEVDIAAAFDAEPGFGAFNSAALWAIGYLVQHASTYYDYGSADAYPCDHAGIPLPHGMGCADWYANQTYTIAWQGGVAVPLPEMYGADHDDLQAGYWYAVKRWSIGNSQGELQFGGVTTHYHSSGTSTYTPAQGWQVLWLSINGDPQTQQNSYLSTDFCDILNPCNTTNQ